MADKDNMPDELADRLDAALPPNQDTVPVGDPDVLVNLAIQLAREPRPEMSPETMARIQAKVLDVHRQHYPTPRPALRFPAAPLLRWAAVLVIGVFFFGSAMIPAAASSLPGELLYPVKLGIERIEIVTASSPATLSVVHLNHAERRLSEAQLLLERGQFEITLLTEGWTSLAESAKIVQTVPSTHLPYDVQARAEQVNVGLNAVLLQAEQSGIVSPDEIAGIRVDVIAAENISPTPVPTAEPSAPPTIPPTATFAPTVTDAPPQEIIVNIPATEVEPSDTLTPSPHPTEEPSATPTTATLTPTLAETYSIVPTATSTASLAPDTAPTGVATPYTATIFASRGVNVRRGPSPNFEIIAIVQPGSLVEVIGHNTDRTWLYVRLEDRRLGWIAAHLLRAGISPNTVSGQSNPGDFGCDHPGNYCNVPGFDNPGGNNGNGAPGQATGNATGGGPPSDVGGQSSGGGGGPPSGSGTPPDNPGGSTGQGNPPPR